MRKCEEYKEVSRAGKPHQVCAKYTSQDDVIIAKGDSDLGAYSLSPVMGFIKGFNAGELVAPGIASVGFSAGTLLARMFGGKVSSFLEENPLVGGIVGGVMASIPLYWWKGADAARAGLITTGVLGLVTLGLPKLDAMLTDWQNEKQLATSPATSGYVLQKQAMGALPVPEVMDYTNVPSSIKSKMDAKAFGTKTYGKSKW